MRLVSFLSHLNRDYETARDIHLADGEHIVSRETALALASLAQSIAVNGLEETKDMEPDLFVAVARTLLRPGHPGFTKWASKTTLTSTPVPPPVVAPAPSAPSAPVVPPAPVEVPAAVSQPVTPPVETAPAAAPAAIV